MRVSTRQLDGHTICGAQPRVGLLFVRLYKTENLASSCIEYMYIVDRRQTEDRQCSRLGGGSGGCDRKGVGRPRREKKNAQKMCVAPSLQQY